MEILRNEIDLVKDGEPADIQALADRIDSMHDYILSQDNVKFADIVAEGGTNISIHLAVGRSEGESKEQTKHRLDDILAGAFARAELKVESAEHARQHGNVREFAFA